MDFLTLAFHACHCLTFYSYELAGMSSYEGL